MSKFIRNSSPAPTQRIAVEISDDATAAVAQDRTLTLLHMRKMFSEYCKVSLGGGGAKDNDRKLTRMLPLFEKVMKFYSVDELVQHFKEMSAFTGHLSRLFVQEIRIRASNQSTEEAAQAIADFLEPPTHQSTDDAAKGWLLLAGLDYLISSKHLAAVEAACKAALPSTLSKALYLFYDLPSIDVNDGELATRRSSLHNCFIELLTRLCSHSCTGEELARKDDLCLLFSGSSSWCPPSNVIWRKATAHLLMTIASRTLSQSVIKYCHAKGCVAQYLQNVRTGDEGRLTAAERVEMISCLLCILKDSSNVTAILLNDFKEADGYTFLSDFILENELEFESSMRNLLLTFNSAVTAGFNELKPTLSAGLYSLPEFSMPSPIGHGVSVRNVDMFHILVDVFVKSPQPATCNIVLDVISSIYSADRANYFILDKECPLGQFIEHIHTKDKSVQIKFFDLLEFVVFHLNHIPCKEFIALSILLKTQAESNTDCCILCVQSCFRIVSLSMVMRDVYREVGLLEVFTWLMIGFSKRLRADVIRGGVIPEEQNTLALLTIDMLTMLMKGNAANSRVFRECAGSKCLLELIALDGFDEWRCSSLQLMQQLLMLPRGEDDLAALLHILNSSPADQLDLKTLLLKSLLCVLRESHRVRLAFRRVGGYLCIMSLLLNLEGALGEQPQPPWNAVFDRQTNNHQTYILNILDFMNLLFKVLTISMRFEPANAKYFASDVRYDSLTLALKLMNAFGDARCVRVDDWSRQVTLDSCRPYLAICHKIFQVHLEDRVICDDIPRRLLYICYILRLLFNTALDNYEKPSADLHYSPDETSSLLSDNKMLFPTAADSLIVHPGAVLCMLDLLPAIPVDTHDIWSLSVQLYAAEVLKALLRSERNQQVMCDAQMPKRLLLVAEQLFKEDAHLLLPPFHYMLERMSAQAMQPSELRRFLRLDNPLCCRNLDTDASGTEEPIAINEGGPVPLCRVKTLVSMMTPRDHRHAFMPPFVEFDMSAEGFGCILLPSIAPNTTAAPPSATADDSVGGVGTGERVFPPLTGITYSTWIYIEKFSDKRTDPHPIRLLTVTRTMATSGDRALSRRNTNTASTLSDWFNSENRQLSVENLSSPPASSPAANHTTELSCLTIQLSPIDRALLIGTFESDMPGADLDQDTGPTDSFVRCAIPSLMDENRWIHVAIVLTRAVLKQSNVCVYVDGRLQSSQKLHYVVQNPGGGASTLAQASFCSAMIGTPPGPFRKQSRLLWRLGATHLIEESLTADIVQLIYRLGAQYSGSFQTPVIEHQLYAPLVIEERLAFGLHALAMSRMTVAKLARVYNRVDSVAVARYLGISTNENATPIRILHNTVGHLVGSARSLGGVLIGYLGMRTFCPFPVARLLESVGGVSSLFGLVAMANDSEGLYASLKTLLCALRSNETIADQIKVCRGYQTLAMLLAEKSALLNSHICSLMLSLVGTLDSSRETTVIPYQQAFEDLLCDLDVWRNASDDLQRLLYEHFYELITESGEHKENLRIIRQTSLLSRLFFRFSDNPKLLFATKDIVFNLIAAIMQPPPDSNGLLKYGQFITSTLPSTSDFNECVYPFDVRDLQLLLFVGGESQPIDMQLYNIYVRNRCLNILCNSLAHTGGALNQQLCEQLVRVLGVDWLLTLLSPRMHSATVYLALRILLSLASYQSLFAKFRDGSGNGGWLAEADSVVRNRAAVLLGFSVSAHGGAVGSQIDINPELCHCPGLTALEHLLPNHVHLADGYMAMLSLLVGQPTRDIRHLDRFDLDSVWSVVFGLSLSSSVADAIGKAQLCPEAVTPLLAMVRRCIHYQDVPNDNGDGDVHWSICYPQTVIQFLTFLYHNSTDFATYCASEEFIITLMSTLFRDSSSSDAQQTDVTNIDDEQLVVEENGAHPCRRAIIEFLKSILIDSLHSFSSGKTEPLVDIVIDSTPEFSTKRDQCRFVTEIMQTCMEHLLAADVLLLGGQSMPLNAAANNSASSYATLATNVFYLSSRLVDCLWNGLFSVDATKVLDFLVKLLSQTKRKTRSGIPIDALMQSIDRTLLYMLSRPIDRMNMQCTVIDSLNRVITLRSIIFAPTHNDTQFFACLAHLLFMLTVKVDYIGTRDDEERRFEDGCTKVHAAACHVWEELYMAKKQLLEEKFKSTLVVEVNAARALIGESASQHWQAFVDGEIRGTTRDLAHLHQQIQSKIQKVASGLHRLTSRKGLTTSAPMSSTVVRQMSYISSPVLFMWMRVHTSLIKELVRLQASRYHQWHSHVQKWCMDEWHSVEQELIRERGLWGPSRSSTLDKWRLDSTEGPNRIRRKLVPNHQFYHIYPYRPNLELPESKALRGKVAISRDSRYYYEKMKERRIRTMDSRIIDMTTMVNTPSEEKVFIFRDMQEINASLIRRVSIRPPTSAANDDADAVDDEEVDDDETKIDDVCSIDRSGSEKSRKSDGNLSAGITDTSKKSDETTTISDDLSIRGADTIDTAISCATSPNPSAPAVAIRAPDNQTLLRLLEEGEQLHSMFRCARIQGLDTSEGLLLFGKESYYVIDGFTLLKTREIRDLDFLPEELHDPIVPYTATGATRPPPSTKRICSKFAYDDIREVHKRRYLLQPIALEVFSADGRNYLLAFPKKMRNRVNAKFLSVAKALNDSGVHSVSGQRASMSVEQTGRSSILNSLTGESSVTQRWVRSEISNFQYLMHLNTLAGRSYNDLSQYPVFPWILRDYDSEVLDLLDPNTFRDLSKPMGAQTPDRLEQFLKRYREWDDPTGDTPPYMYGTHYSSAMIVVSYLVRLEPFTQQFLKLQGGHFDLADRMFHSIKDAWLSASKNNMADVKELIPEFFYLPEFLLNGNNFDFGVKQNGIALHDVVLPAWAKGDAMEFVRVHREALESDYVSAHLHDWIDLMFGAKQQGQPAVDAENLYHHLFYEGNVDFESIEDPLTRNATIGFINNFGQIPTQLFRKLHPRKAMRAATDTFCSTPGVTTDRLFFHAPDCLKPPSQPVKELKAGVGVIIQNDKGVLCAVEQNKLLLPTSYARYVAWGFADRSIRIGSCDTDKSICMHELSECGEITCALASNARTLITGSTNTVINVWQLSKGNSRCAHVLRLRKSLYGHTDAISCLAVSVSYGLVISGSRDGTCIVWDLSSLSLIRQLRPHSGPVSAVAVNEATGDIASSSGTHLFVWTINGRLLAAVNTASHASTMRDDTQLILCVAFTSLNEWDAHHIVMIGSNDGVIRMYSFDMVQVPIDGTIVQPPTDASQPKVDADDEQSPRETNGTSAPPPLRQLCPEMLHERLNRQKRRLNSGSLDTPSAEMPSSRAGWSQSTSPEPPFPPDSDSGFTTPAPQQSFGWSNISSESMLDADRCGSTLKSGYRWQRRLMLRYKLSMHTAFERKDNPVPAAVTALSASRDHRTLYVGDARGRVWAWPLGDHASTGARADHWIQDAGRNSCTQCHQRFSIAERKHHCRNCGQIFCARCSRFESEIRNMKIGKPVRVCQSCYLRLRAESL